MMRIADLVVMLERRVVVESGSYEELVKRKGRLKALVRWCGGGRLLNLQPGVQGNS